MPAPEPESTMSWSSAIGLGARLDEAVDEASEQLQPSGITEPDLVVAFVSAAYGASIERLPQLLRPLLGDGLLFGCNAGGLIGGGTEEEEEPGLALLCGRLPDASLGVVHLEQATLPPLSASRENWWRLLDLGAESGASFLLLADPGTIDAEACARGIDRAFPGSSVISGLASGALEPGTARLLTNDGIHRSGGILLALSGNVVIDPVVAQGSHNLRVLLSFRYDGPAGEVQAPVLRVVGVAQSAELRVPGNLSVGLADVGSMAWLMSAIAGPPRPTKLESGRAFGQTEPLTYYAVDVPPSVRTVRVIFGDAPPQDVEITQAPKKR